MTLNPSHDLKVMLPELLATLKQAAQDPDSVDIDMGDAQQVRDALSNLINAKQGGEGGGGGKQGKSKSAKASSSEEDEGDDEQKKNRSGQ